MIAIFDELIVLVYKSRFTGGDVHIFKEWMLEKSLDRPSITWVLDKALAYEIIEFRGPSIANRWYWLLV